MDRVVTARFYEVVEMDVGVSFREALENVDNIITRADRERDLGNDLVLRLEHLETHGNLIVGDMTRIQTENLPGAPNDVTVNPLQDDRLGHSFGFCFDTTTNSIALQFHTQAQIGKVMSYLSEFSNGGQYAGLPILNEAMVEMLQDRTATKFQMNISSLSRFIAANEDNGAPITVGMARLANNADAKRLNFTMTATRDDPLETRSLIQMARDGLRAKSVNSSVRSIKVETAEDDYPLDLMGGLLKRSDRLDLPSNDPTRSRPIRLRQVRAWHTNLLPYITDYMNND